MKDLLSLIIGFAPWILFLLLSGHTLTSLEISIVISLLASLLFGFKELRRGFLLQWGTLFFFASCLVLVNFMKVIVIAEYMGIISNGFLALIVWVSIMLGKPFTLQYARANCPKERWHDPTLIKRCRFIALVWACLLTLATFTACIKIYKPHLLPDYVYFDISIGIIFGGIIFTHL